MPEQSRPRGSFGTTKKNIPNVMFRSKAMYNGFSASVGMLGSPPISMQAFLALITALVSSQEVATETKAKGSAALRNTKRDAVWTAMEVLLKYAQSIADTMTVDNAISLFLAAGLLVTKVGAHQKAVLTAALTETQGNVLLEATRTLLVGKADASKKAYFNWQWSPDGGKTWNSATPTPLASTEIPGLTPLTMYSFRVSVTVSKVIGPWSQAVSLLVH
jgi:hypothetical protein